MTTRFPPASADPVNGADPGVPRPACSGFQRDPLGEIASTIGGRVGRRSSARIQAHAAGRGRSGGSADAAGHSISPWSLVGVAGCRRIGSTPHSSTCSSVIPSAGHGVMSHHRTAPPPGASTLWTPVKSRSGFSEDPALRFLSRQTGRREVPGVARQGEAVHPRRGPRATGGAGWSREGPRGRPGRRHGRHGDRSDRRGMGAS